MLSTVCSPVICCLNVVLDGWGATTFGGLVGAKSALAAARASRSPNTVFSADRSHSRVVFVKNKSSFVLAQLTSVISVPSLVSKRYRKRTQEDANEVKTNVEFDRANQ